MTYMSFPKYQDAARLLLRIAIGATFIVHGLMKVGSDSTLMQVLSICEPLAGIAFILGLLTPVAALGTSVVMVAAIWPRLTGGMPYNKFEFETLLLVVSIYLIIAGPGAYSLDALIKNRKK